MCNYTDYRIIKLLHFTKKKIDFLEYKIYLIIEKILFINICKIRISIVKNVLIIFIISLFYSKTKKDEKILMQWSNKK